MKLIALETAPTENQPRPTEPDPAGDALTALLTLLDDTTRTLTSANLESFYGMIPRWSWENRALIETRITALMNAINAAQHTWEHFLHQLIPRMEIIEILLPGRPGSKLRGGGNIA